jgi:hypothetical protein
VGCQQQHVSWSIQKSTPPAEEIYTTSILQKKDYIPARTVVGVVGEITKNTISPTKTHPAHERVCHSSKSRSKISAAYRKGVFL